MHEQDSIAGIKKNTREIWRQLFILTVIDLLIFHIQEHKTPFLFLPQFNLQPNQN